MCIWLLVNLSRLQLIAGLFSPNRRFCKSCKSVLFPVNVTRTTLHLSPLKLSLFPALSSRHLLRTGNWGQTLDVWHQGKLKTVQILLPEPPVYCHLCFWHLFIFSAGGKRPGVCPSAQISGWCKWLWGSRRSSGAHDWNHREGEFGFISV